MGLYRRKNRDKNGVKTFCPVYWMCFTVDGKSFNESTGTVDREIAQKIYDILKGKIALGQWHPETIKEEKRKYTFRELAESYEPWMTGRQRGARQKASIIKHLVEYFGDTLLIDFNTHIVEAVQSQRIQKGNKPATINHIIATLKHMFTKAGEWDMVNEAVLKSVRKVKMLTENNRRLRYLSKEECQALVNACEPHLKPIVITALNTGMRRGEILGLKWDNVDLKHGFFLLDITKNGERREIPINDTLKGVLKSMTRRLDVPYVFYDPMSGKPYGDVKRSFSTALRRAKITDFHFHDLRHTFASHLIMAGVDLTTVKELLGHKDIKMTLRYSHLAPSHKVEAVKRIDNVLNSEKPSSEGIKKDDYYVSTTSTQDQKVAGV